MRPLSILIALFMLTAFVIAALMPLARLRPLTGRQRTMTIAFSMLLILGICGFLGNAMSAMGGLAWLPPTFEWPAGYCRNVVTTPQGMLVVAHVSSRIQLYDANWSFIRGWYVEANGGAFHVTDMGDDTLTIATSRGKARHVYRMDGSLLESGVYDRPTMPPPHPDTRAAWVPTAPWLIGFTHPIAGWFLAAVGLCGFVFAGPKGSGKADAGSEVSS